MSIELVVSENVIPAMNLAAIDRVRHFENVALQMPQIPIDTSHVIHGSIYARTIMIPASTILTGALIKIATLLIIQGDVTVFIGDETIHLTGYNVLPAGANRKQAFIANTDTYMTMLFSTNVKSVKEAEDIFTDEADTLISRKEAANNHIMITGE